MPAPAISITCERGWNAAYGKAACRSPRLAVDFLDYFELSDGCVGLYLGDVDRSVAYEAWNLTLLARGRTPHDDMAAGIFRYE